MPAASAEALSLLAYCTLHFGQQPDAAWVRALLQESMFKMEEVRVLGRGGTLTVPACKQEDSWLYTCTCSMQVNT